MSDDPNRKFEIARGVRIQDNPEKFSRDEAIDALYEVAQFASQKLYDNITLQRIIQNIHTPK